MKDSVSSRDELVYQMKSILTEHGEVAIRHLSSVKGKRQYTELWEQLNKIKGKCTAEQVYVFIHGKKQVCVRCGEQDLVFKSLETGFYQPYCTACNKHFRTKKKPKNIQTVSIEDGKIILKDPVRIHVPVCTFDTVDYVLLQTREELVTEANKMFVDYPDQFPGMAIRHFASSKGLRLHQQLHGEVGKLKGKGPSEKLYRYLYGQQHNCSVCGTEDISFVSWEAGFKENCSVCSKQIGAELRAHNIKNTFLEDGTPLQDLINAKSKATKLAKVDENNLNSYQRGAWKTAETRQNMMDEETGLTVRQAKIEKDENNRLRMLKKKLDEEEQLLMWKERNKETSLKLELEYAKLIDDDNNGNYYTDLYVVIDDVDNLIQIGVSMKLQERINTINSTLNDTFNDSRKVKLLYSIKLSMLDAAILENKLHTQYKEHKIIRDYSITSNNDWFNAEIFNDVKTILI